MSIEKAKISRSLIVKSPIHLWKIFTSKKEIYDKSNSVIMFNYSIDRYINGCKCDEDTNRDLVLEEYKNVKNDISVKNMILEELSCQDIFFTEDENW